MSTLQNMQVNGMNKQSFHTTSKDIALKLQQHTH
jgi:hypothetical protein